MKKIISIFLIIITLLLTSACSFNDTQVEPEITQMRAICELATLDCYYHNVAKFQQEGKFLWNRDKHFWIEYDGVVKIGIDASLVVIQIDENDTVTITVPEAKVLDCIVTPGSLKYFVDADSAKIKADDETKAMGEAKTKMEEAAKSDNALLINAQERAKKLLENYVKNIGDCIGKQYNIIWKDVTETINSKEQISENSTNQN